MGGQDAGLFIQVLVEMDKYGRVVIPAEVRRFVGVKPPVLLKLRALPRCGDEPGTMVLVPVVGPTPVLP